MATQFLGTYDPKKVTFMIGTYMVSGFADGTFIKTEMVDPEIYKNHCGARGEVSRTKNPNMMGKFTFTLKQTSPSNAILDLLKESPVPLPAILTDNSDAKFGATGVNCWVNNRPSIERAMEESKVEWIVWADELLQAHMPIL
jgi:hypothetical protein